MDLSDESLAAKRAAARERKRKSRQKQKLKVTQEQEKRFLAYSRYNPTVGAGELEPDVFARTDAEWIFCARRFAQAAGLRDIQQGESINDFERRIYGNLCLYDERAKLWVMPLLNLATLKFDQRFETVLDQNINDVRFFLPEHDAPIDVSALPPISQRSRGV